MAFINNNQNAYVDVDYQLTSRETSLGSLIMDWSVLFIEAIIALRHCIIRERADYNRTTTTIRHFPLRVADVALRESEIACDRSGSFQKPFSISTRLMIDLFALYLWQEQRFQWNIAYFAKRAQILSLASRNIRHDDGSRRKNGKNASEKRLRTLDVSHDVSRNPVPRNDVSRVSGINNYIRLICALWQVRPYLLSNSA